MVVGAIESDRGYIISEVGQGLVLGPLLFVNIKRTLWRLKIRVTNGPCV